MPPQSAESIADAPTVPPSPPPGTVDAMAVPGYDILRELGRGGMGIVYQARQARLDRLVAIKVLPAEAGRDQNFVERFTREARALARLNHPNIVTVHDFGQDGENYYFVMEFVEGTNLRQRLRAGPMAPAEVFRIIVRICDALEYAHGEGIVHRDIKPENILLDKKSRVKIADFGIAKLLTQSTANYTLTGPWQVVGTWHYMAPEQLDNPRGLDHRADIYSLGVMFYEMLTGKLPQGKFAPPSQMSPVDAALDDIVLRALEREPERRFQTVEELRTAIEGLVEGGAMASLARDTETLPSSSRANRSGAKSVAPAPAPEVEQGARKRVMQAAIPMFICGVLCLLAPVVTALVVSIYARGRQTDWWESADLIIKLLVLDYLLLAPLIGGLWVWSALRMLRFRSYGWAVISSLLAVFPWSNLWVFTVWFGVFGLLVLRMPKVRAAFAAQEDWDIAHNAPKPLPATTGGWVLICCVAGILLCLQPVLPWSVLHVIDAHNQRHALAEGYGYQSFWGFFPALLLFGLILFLVLTGFAGAVSGWQAGVRMFVGVTLCGLCVGLITEHKSSNRHNIQNSRGSIGMPVIGNHAVQVHVAQQTGGGALQRVDYEVSGRTASVLLRLHADAIADAITEMVGALRVTVQPVVYFVAGLGLAILFLGTLDLRAALGRQ